MMVFLPIPVVSGPESRRGFVYLVKGNPINLLNLVVG